MNMESYKKRVIGLISNLLLEYKKDPTVVAHYPSKTEVMRRDRHRLTRSTPEAHGICSTTVAEMLTELENDPRVNLHSIVITKDGEVIAEASAPGYDASLPHLSHSMSKTVTGILIESLIDSGEVSKESLVCELLPEYKPRDERLYSLTLRHLLTMSSGVAYAEVGSVSEREWTRAFFESELIFTPGEEFIYNSMNSYVLMHVADRIARKGGTDATELLWRRIFEPMGIENPYWELSPEGVPKGGWGLYLSCESWARLGIMMMRGGEFNGRRILSEEAVRRATEVAMSVPREVSEYNYGHQLWVDGEGGFLFNGMLGQNVWVYPEGGIVVAMNAGNSELMQKSPALTVIKRALRTNADAPLHRIGRDLDDKCKSFFTSRTWITLHAPLRGLPYLLGLKSRTPFDTRLLPLVGKYLFPTNNLCLLPAFVSVMQNNYGAGIESIEFSRLGEIVMMRTVLGCAEIEIPLGIYSYTECVVTQRGERFLVRGAISAQTDKEGLVYKIELILPEMPNTRRILLTLSNSGRLHVRLTEVPGEEICQSLMRVAQMTNPRLSSLFAMLERTLGRDYLPRKMGELFTPEITAISAAAPDKDIFLAEENERMAARISSSRLVRSIVTRISKEEASQEAERPALRARLSELLSRFGRK